MSINSIVKASIFCALAIGLGFVFMPVPNFEFITVTVFLSGLYLNCAWGFLIGSTTIMIYSGFNPMGSGLAFPPLFLGQTLTMGLIGISGGIDSAVTSTLCAITGHKTYVVVMPIHQKQDETERGIEHCNWLKEKYSNDQYEISQKHH